MKKPLATIVSLAGLAAVGTLAALTLASPALAWGPTDLPPGWSVIHMSTLGSGYCHESYTILTTGHADISSPFCTDSPTYQADFDAWIDARYTLPTTAATTAPATVAATVTVTTETQPAAPLPPSTTADAQAQIADLQSQIAALRLRVDHLEAAADAEWLAYHDALVAGVDPIIASMIARQTGYDLIHGTGAFAP